MSAERTGQPTRPINPATPPGGQPTNGPEQFPGTPQPGSPAETAGLVRGLQAWMADLDRRLSIRTKLLLGLVAIAIGAAGAAIFLSVEANRTTASQEDFAELQQQVEQLREQLGVAPSESEPEDATGATGATEDSADEAGAAGETGSPGDETGSAANDAEPATGEAGSEARGGADDPASIIEEAMKERFDELSEEPPMPDIGSD